MSKDGVSLLVFRLDNDIVGFSNGNPEFIDRHWLNVLTVGCDNRHFQAGDPHVEIGHRRAIDKAKPDFLPWLEDSRPVPIWRLAVHEVGVGVPAHVSEIGWAHLHLGPHLSIGHSSRPTFLAHVVDEVANGALVEVVVVRLFFELGHNPRRVFVGPITQHDDIVTIVGERLWILGINHQRTVNTDLLLEARMAVVPVGAVLVDLELVLVHAVGSDAMEA